MSIPADAPDAIEPGDTDTGDLDAQYGADRPPAAPTHEQVDERNHPKPDVPGQHSH